MASIYNNNWKLFCLLVIFCTSISFSQDWFSQSQKSVQTGTFYEEIEKLQDETYEKNEFGELKKLSQIHLEKARNELDSVEMANAYYYLTINEKPKVAIAYADSIIVITSESNHYQYPTLGYFIKGHIYYGMGKFEPALQNYLKAHSLALKKNNIEQQREISLSIAAIRNIKGQHYVAADLYKQTLKGLTREPEFEREHYHDHVTLLYNLSLTHLRLFQLDSACYYIRKGHKQALKYSDATTFMDFSLVDAQLNFYRKDYSKAKDTILKYIHHLNGTSRAIKLYYMGKIEQKEENGLVAIEYFQKIDSIVTETQDPFSEVKDVYQQLVMHSSLENNRRQQVEYIQKLIHYDSLLTSQQGEITNQIMIGYDIPYLKRQKKQAEDQLKAKSMVVTAVGSLAGLAILSGGFFYYRTRKVKTRLKILLEGINEKNSNPKDPGEHPASVPEEIRAGILKKLEVFEDSDLFLRKDLDMSVLAQVLGTNTSYLSIIINHYKRMTFPNYLKDLKISSAIHRLSRDPELLKYNYQGLAELFGFKTAESFSKAFYRKTGVYPSKFLNELKSRENASHL